jgi:hypothetical protein
VVPGLVPLFVSGQSFTKKERKYKAAEDLAPDADPGVRSKEVEQAVDLYADTLAGAFNHAVHVGLPDWTKHGVARWLYEGKGGSYTESTLACLVAFFTSARASREVTPTPTRWRRRPSVETAGVVGE